VSNVARLLAIGKLKCEGQHRTGQRGLAEHCKPLAVIPSVALGTRLTHLLRLLLCYPMTTSLISV